MAQAILIMTKMSKSVLSNKRHKLFNLSTWKLFLHLSLHNLHSSNPKNIHSIRYISYSRNRSLSRNISTVIIHFIHLVCFSDEYSIINLVKSANDVGPGSCWSLIKYLCFLFSQTCTAKAVMGKHKHG
jgi:hypothetical protein